MKCEFVWQLWNSFNHSFIKLNNVKKSGTKFLFKLNFGAKKWGLVQCKMRFHTNWNIFFFTHQKKKSVMLVINSKRATHTTFSLCSRLFLQKMFPFYKILLHFISIVSADFPFIKRQMSWKLPRLENFLTNEMSLQSRKLPLRLLSLCSPIARNMAAKLNFSSKIHSFFWWGKK